MKRIDQLKAMLPKIPDVVTGLKKESENSLCGPCPKCGGIDRFVYKTDTERFFCRRCESQGDVIDFHSWVNNETTSDLFKRYLPKDDQYHQKEPGKKESSPAGLWDSLQKNTNTDPVFRLFSDRRKINRDVVSQSFDQGKIRFLNHDGKAAVACAYTELNQNKNVLAIQCLSVDGSNFAYAEANKVFTKASKAGDNCFFQAGTDIEKADSIILCEAVIDALSCAECIPEACILAIGGTSLSKKVKALRPYRDSGKRIICFFDCDKSGQEATQRVARMLGVKTMAVQWTGNTPGGYDINNLLKTGEHKPIIEMVQNAKPVKIEKSTEGAKQKTKIVVMNRFSPRPWSIELCKKYNLIYDLQKRLWIFDPQNGLWNENAETVLEVELRKNLLGDELLKQHYIAEILADVKSLAFTQEESPEPPPHLIPFKNIIYNLKTDEQLKYNPKFFFTSKLAVNFNPEATCPFIDGIFSQLVDDPIHLYELAAYCLYRTYPYQKWFFLYGNGGNGKGVFLSMLESLLGKQNIRSITTEQFTDNHFAVADLHKKFANLCGEMNYSTLEKTAILKQLVGGDLLRAERKYKEPFYFNNYAKLIFNTNSLPKTTDKTRAFYRRLYLIEFPNKFEGSSREDKLLLQKITPGELEGLAIKCLGYLMELYDRGFFFVNDRGVDELTQEYEKLTNPLITFLAEATERDVNSAIPKWELRNLFIQRQSDRNSRIWNATQISKEMKMLGYDDGRYSFEGSSQRCWFGLKWN